MKNYFFLIILFYCSVNSQNIRLEFSYDSAGNQITRELNFNSNSAKNSLTKEVKETITEEDLLKFAEEDIISYYPNPVKEQLYLKWQLTNDVVVNTIQVFALDGRLIKNMTGLEKSKDTTISFQEFPAATYLIHIHYSNGKQESITIIKN